jgi:hypothetical protein
MPSRKAVYEMLLRSLVTAHTCRLLYLPQVKIPLKGRHFQTVEVIQCAVTRELNNISKTVFPGGHEEVKGSCK